MKRKALIIYCNDTKSGKLAGPAHDNLNYRNYLKSNLGGNWYNDEIISLKNPTTLEVDFAINTLLKGADYTFTIFTGHGYINYFRNQQVELIDNDIPISKLKTNAKRQTLIIDACRGFFQPNLKKFSDLFEQYVGDVSFSTRELFDRIVMNADEGLSILYAANKNQKALDTNKGAAYLLSLLQVAKRWEVNGNPYNYIDLNIIHQRAVIYMNNNFNTPQNPTTNKQNRSKHFPFAVKLY